MKLGRKDLLIYILIVILLFSVIYSRNQKFLSKENIKRYIHLNRDDIFLYKLALMTFLGKTPEDGWKIVSIKMMIKFIEYIEGEYKRELFSRFIRDYKITKPETLLDYFQNYESYYKVSKIRINRVRIIRINEAIANIAIYKESSEGVHIVQDYIIRYNTENGWHIVDNITKYYQLKNDYKFKFPK